MSYVIFKHPAIRMDLMVRRELWPKLVSHIARCDCTYAEERTTVNKKTGEAWVCVKDVRSLRGYKIGELIGLFYGLEWEIVQKDEEDNARFYILLNPRKGGYNNARKNRKTAGARRQGRNTGKPAGDIQPGPDSGHRGNDYQPACLSPDDIRGLEIPEISDDDCE